MPVDTMSGEGLRARPRAGSATMRAAVIAAPRKIEIQEEPIPEPTGDQVRVRIKGCGVCASNLSVWQGRPWFDYPQPLGAPGHEGWGVIDAVGPAANGRRVGERVALLSYNAFAEYDLAPADSVVALPRALDDAPFPAEAFGCALNIFRRSALSPRATVAVIGVGFQGALLTALAAQADCRVFAIARRPWPLHLARKLGAEAAILMTDRTRVGECVGELTDGRGCDVVIEATGAAEPLNLAGDLVATGGRLVVAGFHQDGPREIDMQTWNWKGIDVVNAHERKPSVYVDGMRRAAEAVSRKILNTDLLLTHQFPLERLDEAFDCAESRPEGFLKAWVSV